MFCKVNANLEDHVSKKGLKAIYIFSLMVFSIFKAFFFFKNSELNSFLETRCLIISLMVTSVRAGKALPLPVTPAAVSPLQTKKNTQWPSHFFLNRP